MKIYSIVKGGVIMANPITFMKNSSDRRCLQKTLDDRHTYDFEFKSEVDYLRPIIICKGKGFTQYNYCYIPLLNRYYFINSIIGVCADIVELHLEVDVLLTYREQLSELNCFVLRNEYIFNPNYNDNKLPIRSDTNYIVKQFGNVAEQYNYYLTANGGVH